ncbi:VWA domain-containing protein, partial [Chroococcidiopsis sp [FACHB-1243]]|uniref:vWA domain-containing protein n=1 Tax=Chroococcidiopsis sp. [FACHB-1243] TaxID=2692781 RepID=UPI001F54D058
HNVNHTLYKTFFVRNMLLTPLPKTVHHSMLWLVIQLLQQEGKQAVWQAQQYAASLDETQVRQMLRAALSAADEKLSEASGWLEMLGLSWGNEIGGERSVSSAEKMALAQKIASNTKLKQIAVVAGRLQQIAERKRRSQALDAFGEITTIELGNNLSRLLPSELQKLSAPDLFPLFALSYYDRSLLQYKTRGKEKQCKGPLVVCLDSSGSMDGLPDTWAKAVTAVLGQIAQREGRHLRVIHFATRVCRVDDFPPHHHDFSRLLESMLAFYNGGGTAWEPALLSATECIEQQQKFKQADIVMVTDGKCDLEREFLEQLKVKKQQREFNIYGVLIGGAGERLLKQFCDRVWVVRDLISDEVAIEELFLL